LHPGLRFHDLRHTHKTMLDELGVPKGRAARAPPTRGGHLLPARHPPHARGNGRRSPRPMGAPAHAR
jgi:hypothetical protein